MVVWFTACEFAGALRSAAARWERLLGPPPLTVPPRPVAAWSASGSPPRPVAAWSPSAPPVGSCGGRIGSSSGGGVGCTVVGSCGVGVAFYLDLFFFLVFFLVLIILRLLLTVAVGPPVLASPFPVRDSGVFRSDVESVSSSVSLSGVGRRSGIGVRGSLPSKAQSRRAVLLYCTGLRSVQ